MTISPAFRAAAAGKYGKYRNLHLVAVGRTKLRRMVLVYRCAAAPVVARVGPGCAGTPGAGAQIHTHAWVGRDAFDLATLEVLYRVGEQARRVERVVPSLCGLSAGIGLVCLGASLLDSVTDPHRESRHANSEARFARGVSTRGVAAAGSREVALEPLPDVVSRAIVRKNPRLSIHDAYSFSGGPPLGAGAFGVVYRAVDAVTGVERAVKRVDKLSAGKKFPRIGEIEALLRTDHPNICRLVEYFEADRYLWLVMELCPGEELCSLLLRSPCGLPEQRAGHLLAQMLRAALHCHRHAGIIHRDLKPENFLLQGDVLKLIDFGFAATAGASSSSFGVCPNGRPSSGTLLYMSPQMLRGEPPASSDDVWSLGVVFYILLTGRFPFSTNDDDDFEDMIAQGHLEQDVKNHLDMLNVSPSALDLAKKLLIYDSFERISAEEALQHPFLAEAWLVEADQLLRPEDVRDRCVNFKQAAQLRRIAAAATARFVAQDDCSIQPLRDTFLALDAEGDGRLPAADLQTFLHTGSETGAEHLPTRLADNTSAALRGLADRRGIGYTAFVAAMLDDGALLGNEQLAKAIFDVLDADQDGVVSATDLHRRLGLRLEDSERAIAEAFSVLGTRRPHHGVFASFRKGRESGVDFTDFLRVLQQHDSLW